MMQEAEITSFLRTLFIIFLVWYGLKVIGKYVAPFILRRAVNKFEEKIKSQQQQASKSNVKVGETVIDKKPRDEKTSNSSVGEYVDFEEVDE